MSFRDDRRAAEERIRILEQEMDRLRDAEQRADALATDLGETRAALEAAQRRVAALEEARRPSRRRRLIGLALVGATVAMGWAYRTRPVAGAPAATWIDEGVTEIPIPDPPPVPDPAEEAEPLQGSSLHGSLEIASSADPRTLTWKARVLRATGIAVPAGARCTVEVTASGWGGYGGSLVRCGREVLYDSSAPMSGMSSLGADLDELVVGEGAQRRYQFRVRIDDIGPRTGERSQLTLSTSDKQAVAFRETAPVWRVVMAVDKHSAPAETSLFAPDVTVDTAPLERGATVAETTGEPLPKGLACRLRLAFDHFQHGAAICRATLRCGEIGVFEERARCALEQDTGKPWLFETTRSAYGPPTMRIDLRERIAKGISEMGGRYTFVLDEEAPSMAGAKP